MVTSHGDGDGPAPSWRENIPSHHEPIAIVGIGCRFPGRANDAETAFWRLLKTAWTPSRKSLPDCWDLRTFHDPDPLQSLVRLTSRWGGFVGAPSTVSSTRHFFGISPREAARMDPQQPPHCSKSPGRGSKTPDCGSSGSPAAGRCRLRRTLQLRITPCSETKLSATATRSTCISEYGRVAEHRRQPLGNR